MPAAGAATVTVHVRVNISLWDALKLRLALGPHYDRLLAELDTADTAPPTSST